MSRGNLIGVASVLLVVACAHRGPSVASAGTADPAWQCELLTGLRRVSHENLLAKMNSADTERLRTEAQWFDSVVSLPGALELWRRQDTSLDLIWYKQASRATRALVVSFFPHDIHNPLQRPRPKGAAPGFRKAALRFSATERKRRLEEIDFVLSHYKALADQIHAAYEKLEQSEADKARSKTSVPWQAFLAVRDRGFDDGWKQGTQALPACK